MSISQLKTCLVSSIVILLANYCQTASARVKSTRSPVSLNSDPVNNTTQAEMFGSMLDSSSNTTIRKKHLIVATIEAPPFVMKRLSSENNLTVEWFGYCIDFFHELIKHLPYEVTYEIYHVADNKFGTKMKHVTMETVNGSKYSVPKKIEYWNGLIGDLQKGKAHLALAPLAVMAERELVIDFTVPFYDLVGIQILLKKPEVPQDWFKFLTVLDNEVWLSITIAYFVTSFVIFLFDRLSPYSQKNLTRLRRSKQGNRDKTNVDGKMVKTHHPLSTISNGRDVNNYSINYMTNTTKPPLQLGSNTNVSALPLSSSDILQSKLFLNSFKTDDKNNKALKSDDKEGSNSRAGRISTEYWNTLRTRNSQGAMWDHENISESSDIDDGKPDFGLRDSLWFCITSLTPQGGGEAPQNLSGRVVAGSWWLFCFIVIASYTANLAAFLTVSRLDIPIESLDDLAKQYRIKYAPVDGTAEQTYFERMAYIEEIFYNIWKEMSLNHSLSEDERSKFAVWDYPISDKYTKIWAQIQEVGMPPDIDTGIKRVKSSSLDDGFALLADANLVKHAVMTDCSFKAVGDEFSRKPIALGVRKGFEQLKDDISYAILQLINQRFMEVLREKWWTNNPMRIVCHDNDESDGISIENIGGVFVIIIAGVVLSFIVWAFERFIYKTRIDLSKSVIEGLNS